MRLTRYSWKWEDSGAAAGTESSAAIDDVASARLNPIVGLDRRYGGEGKNRRRACGNVENSPGRRLFSRAAVGECSDRTRHPAATNSKSGQAMSQGGISSGGMRLVSQRILR